MRARPLLFAVALTITAHVPASAFMIPKHAPAAMVAIPGGTFSLASTGATVTVAPFRLDAFEVTVDAYAVCVAHDACKPPPSHVDSGPDVSWAQFCNWGAVGLGDHPVNCIDYPRAEAYCVFAGKRLPTAEEWEWAARNGDRADVHPWGADDPNAKVTNACGTECVAGAAKRGLSWLSAYDADDGWPETSPIGAFPAGANRWGVQDLVGNVAEWTSTSPPGSETKRALMGANWSTYGHTWLTAGARDDEEQTTVNSSYGVRCAL